MTLQVCSIIAVIVSLFGLLGLTDPQESHHIIGVTASVSFGITAVALNWLSAYQRYHE